MITYVEIDTNGAKLNKINNVKRFRVTVNIVYVFSLVI